MFSGTPILLHDKGATQKMTLGKADTVEKVYNLLFYDIWMLLIELSNSWNFSFPFFVLYENGNMKTIHSFAHISIVYLI